MDTRIHTRFPRWIRVSIAGVRPAGRDGFGYPSQGSGSPGAMDPGIHRGHAASRGQVGPGAPAARRGQARAERAAAAAAREP